MRLLYLELVGAIGVKKGLGLDRIAIDFRKFDRGIILFVGPCGTSKTTVMENLVLYRELRSRPESFGREFFLRNSRRELLVEIDGHQYRSVIEINAGRKDPLVKSYIWEDGKALNEDGNEKGYNEIVERLCGDKKLFYSSVFMPQMREPFSELKDSERNAVILKLVGAEILEKKKKAVDAKAKLVKELIGTTSAELAGFEAANRSVESIDEEIRLCSESLADDRLKSIDAETEVSNRKMELESWQKKQTLQADAELRLSDAKRRNGALTTEKESITADFKKRIAVLQIVLDSDTIAIGNLSDKCTPDQEAIIDGRIKEEAETKILYNGTIENRKQYDALKLQEYQANTELLTAKSSHEKKLADLQTELDKAIADRTKEFDSFTTKKTKLAEDINSMTRGSVTLDTVPCQTLDQASAEKCQSCQFIKDAAGARLQIDPTQKQLVDTEEIWSDLSRELSNWVSECEAAVNGFTPWEQSEDCIRLTASLQSIRDQVTALAFDAASSDALKKKHDLFAQVNYSSKKQEIIDARGRVGMLQQKIDANTTRITELGTEEKAALNRIDEDIKACEADMASIAQAVDITIPLRLSSAREAHRKAEADRKALIERIARAEGNIERLRADRLKAEGAGEKIAELQQTLAKLRTRLADLTHLADCLSRNGGYQSLLVESYGAMLTPLVNAQLENYGVPWTVEILTSRPLADRKGETDGFFVMVNSPDGTCELSKLSGGEKTIVDQAIYGALCEMLRQQSGLKIETAFKDESDGSLHIEWARSYLQSIERSMESSGLWNVIMISHRPEIQEMVNQKVIFHKNEGIEINISGQTVKEVA